MRFFRLIDAKEQTELPVTILDLVHSEIKLDASDLMVIDQLQPGDKYTLPDMGVIIVRTH